MSPVRLGAVGFLNARPLAYGLDRDPRFALRFDLPARCADLLHAGEIDIGLIPSIEYQRAPAAAGYVVLPDLAIASNGPVASVALYTTRDMRDVRSIALDTSSRTSVALVRVMCARVFGIAPRLEHRPPVVATMLQDCDAALIIGDNALFLDGGMLDVPAGAAQPQVRRVAVHKVDLGDLWTRTTGLPFVYAFWAGRPGAIDEPSLCALQQARDRGCARTSDIAVAFFPGDAARQAVGERYLRDNIKYHLGPAERAGLERFYQYAAEAGVVPGVIAPRFFGDEDERGRGPQR